MGELEKMCRLTYHLNEVLSLYKQHYHGAIDNPIVLDSLDLIDDILSKNQDWAQEVETAKTWKF